MKHWSFIIVATIAIISSNNAVVESSSPLIEPLSWDEAHAKAEKLVSQMSLKQIASITTGPGILRGLCDGNSGSISYPDFPSLCFADGPLGIRGSPFSSAFSAGITVAASFDKEAIRQRGIDMGAEFRNKGAHVQLGPSMDIARNPHSGRNWEAFGEDPYLSGVAAAETIRGIQSQGVQSSIIDDRTMHEIYLWPFARAVEADVGTVMCSYNKLNGTHACENDYVLNHILKKELGFRGWVHSDWLATHSTTKAINSGLDMNMPGDILYFGSALERAVKNGDIQFSRARDMVQRILAAWFKDYPPVRMDVNHPSKDPGVNVQADHSTSIRMMGAAGTVLLRNTDDVLPLDTSSIKKIALFGSDAGSSRANNTSPLVEITDQGTLIQGGGSGSSNAPYIVSPVEAITSRADAFNIDVVSSTSNILEQKTVETAKDADVAIVFAKVYAMEMLDVKSLNLKVDGLIEAVADANKNTIVVIHSGNSIMMPWADHPNIKGILWAGMPGQETGNSLADILFGSVNPSGRLPLTFAKQASDYSADISQKLEFEYEEKLLVGYRWFDAKDIEPRYEFGFGLSYTTFEYKDLHVNVDKATSNVTASIQITNTGSRDGAEVAQLYLAFPEYVHEPPKVLRGFEKVFLEKGHTANISFELTKTELSVWDVKMQKWVVPSGDYEVLIGASSRDIRLHETFSL
ncbi:glycoside hydrolase [Lichtheimia hyalospora FSU 10163]|nr:glycoside hydrolase [Lichtheimia hyalospora FSU 10163]